MKYPIEFEHHNGVFGKRIMSNKRYDIPYNHFIHLLIFYITLNNTLSTPYYFIHYIYQ
jgi:hypothetical protein